MKMNRPLSGNQVKYNIHARAMTNTRGHYDKKTVGMRQGQQQQSENKDE